VSGSEVEIVNSVVPAASVSIFVSANGVIMFVVVGMVF
jgi:hypothetical protein